MQGREILGKRLREINVMTNENMGEEVDDPRVDTTLQVPRESRRPPRRASMKEQAGGSKRTTPHKEQ